jgi:hypothetical protein
MNRLRNKRRFAEQRGVFLAHGIKRLKDTATAEAAGLSEVKELFHQPIYVLRLTVVIDVNVVSIGVGSVPGKAMGEGIRTHVSVGHGMKKRGGVTLPLLSSIVNGLALDRACCPCGAAWNAALDQYWWFWDDGQ